MKLKALERGFTLIRKAIDENDKVVYLTGKVRPGEVFEYRGPQDKPPKWCVPVDDDAKLMYEVAGVVSNKPKDPQKRIAHPSMRNRQKAPPRGAGTGIAGLSEAGVI